MARAERALNSTRIRSEDQDLYLDSAALSLHDFYTGLERIFHHIAANIDKSLPADHDWHRELLRQMGTELPNVRPQVLSSDSIKALDEYLRFRHVVRNIYAFNFDIRRIEYLVKQLRPCFYKIRNELVAFAQFLEHLAS